MWNYILFTITHDNYKLQNDTVETKIITNKQIKTNEQKKEEIKSLLPTKKIMKDIFC